MSGIVLSSSVRQNLLSLQSTASLLATTQNDLSTGNKVNSALDNPTNYFTAQSLNNRAGDINNLLDGIGNGVQVLQAANTGLTSLQSLISSAQSIANQALQTTVGYSTLSHVSTTIAGATSSNLLGTTTFNSAVANSNILYSGLAGGATAAVAGSTLGGGTVINSMACRPLPDDVRADWAAAGLEGVDGSEWDGYFDTVWTALGANSEATVYNRNAEVLIEGLTASGLEHHRIPRNAELFDDPTYCGYCNAGCQQGCKRSVLKNYLQDAADSGARFLVDCFVEKITTDGRQATGVKGRVGETEVTVEAPTVVVACGGIESPALLLRSEIGGPAVGKNLRVHPSYMITGVYDEPVEAWNGQLITVMSFDFQHCLGDSGFYISPLGLSPATWAGQSPWTDGEEMRRHFLKFPSMASWHSITHDHGSGQVVLGEDGRALVRWSMADDELDREVAIRAHTELARVHHAAGAAEIFTFHWTPHHWRRGEDFDAYIEQLEAAPAEEYTAYSAHQMGSCRMGSSPADAVADGRGELHDTRGVWVGDASAFPTATGVNPMVSIMVLAERTADQILAAA